MAEHKQRIVSVLLGVEGGLILLGAVLVGLTGTAIFPFDSFVGTDASVAALVLGAAFVMAFRTPTRTWINLAILYNALTIVFGLVKWGTNFGIRLTLTSTIVSCIFLVCFVVLYPRSGEEMRFSPTA